MPDTAPRGDAVLVHRPGLRTLALPDGGLTVYLAETAAAYVLNASAAQVWRNLDGTRTVDSVVATLREQHFADPDPRPDVLRIVEELHTSLLIVPAGPPAP
jgi:hypothetical protein